jgi:hypothetical protein
MATTIQIKRSSTASAVPLAGDLEVGELAVNLADKRLFTKKSDGTVVELSTNPTDIDIATLRIDGVEVTASAAELNSLDGSTASTADLNKLAAVTATSTELNVLDGFTGSTAELNILDGVTATTAEINKLDGFTGTVDDLNYAKDLRATGVTTTEFDKLDGLTATTAELNITDGLTATTAELNVLDGITATTTELNYTDGVTSNIQTQLDGKAPTASPTFTGTTTIPTVDINGGNIDGAAIGSSEAASGQFTTLVSNSAIIGGELDVTGTVTADGLTVDGDINANNFILSENGEILAGQDASGFYYASGYGTDNTLPIVIGDNNSSIRFRTGNTPNRLQISSNGDIQFYEDTGTTPKMTWDASAESLGVTSSGTALSLTNTNSNMHYNDPVLSIKNSGDGDVNTLAHRLVNLDYNADVDGVVTGTYLRMMAKGVAKAGIGLSSNEFVITDGELTERMVIDSSGNVGIGTSSPQGKLNLVAESSTSDDDTLVLGFSFTSATEALASIGTHNVDANNGGIKFSTRTSNALTEKARIDSSGNLLVGTTTGTQAGNCIVNQQNSIKKTELLKQFDVNGSSSNSVTFDLNAEAGISHTSICVGIEITASVYGNSSSGSGVYKALVGGYASTAGDIKIVEIANSLDNGSFSFSRDANDEYTLTVTNTSGQSKFVNVSFVVMGRV